MSNTYTAPFTVTMPDAGPGGILKISALFNYFQSITAEHSVSIGFGGEDILRQGFHWVITRYRLSVDKLPVVNDKFSITTWRPGEEGHFANRDFLMEDETGNILARATSSWILLDISKMKPVIPSELMPGYPTESMRAIYDTFPSIPGISNISYQKEFHVRRNDLDMNTHVNNSIYASWLAETGEDIYEGHILKEIAINFRREIRYGESILSQAENKNDGTVIHKLINASNGAELTRGITKWDRR